MPDRRPATDADALRLPAVSAEHVQRVLDAAGPQLLPAGSYWRVGHDGEGPDPSLFRGDVMTCGGRGFHGVHETPGGALALASLRVRLAGLV